jgi:16S rRNA C1402 N4-methylase RsmH
MLEDKEIQKNKRRKQKNKHKRQYQALLVVENNELTLITVSLKGTFTNLTVSHCCWL